jgi:agmatinase
MPQFSGIKTFMRLPHVKTYDDIDFAVMGIPFDTGVTYKPGARFGPAAIREASVELNSYSLNLDVDIFDRLSGVDYGDIPVKPGFIHETYQEIEYSLLPFFENGIVPVVLGGDHSITLGELRAAAKKFGPVALVHFDSHQDTWDEFWGMKYTHGTPFRRACEEGLIDTKHSIQVGIRGSQHSYEDIKGAKDLGFHMLTANELHEIGIAEGISRIQERVGKAKAFLTFDIDFVDPSMAPGTGTIEVGGFTGYETLRLVRGLKGINLIGMDIVEVLPVIDPSGITACMAASIVHEVLSILALRKRK